MGAVGCLKSVKNAIAVARNVMERTAETLLVGADGELNPALPFLHVCSWVIIFSSVLLQPLTLQ